LLTIFRVIEEILFHIDISDGQAGFDGWIFRGVLYVGAGKTNHAT
jgi:hypothetical protein